MLSRAKASYLAAATSLVILSGVTVSSNVASAQSRIQLAQAEKRDAQDNRKSESRREQRRETSQSREGRSDREIKSSKTSRTVVRSDHNKRHVVVRDRDRRHVVVHSRPSTSVAFVVLGPRVVYRAYGAGWCRGLHRGRHWDRRIGWHAGRHYGPFRC
jgi:hypothetical protein